MAHTGYPEGNMLHGFLVLEPESVLLGSLSESQIYCGLLVILLKAEGCCLWDLLLFLLYIFKFVIFSVEV